MLNKFTWSWVDEHNKRRGVGRPIRDPSVVRSDGVKPGGRHYRSTRRAERARCTPAGLARRVHALPTPHASEVLQSKGEETMYVWEYCVLRDITIAEPSTTTRPHMRFESRRSWVRLTAEVCKCPCFVSGRVYGRQNWLPASRWCVCPCVCESCKASRHRRKSSSELPLPMI